MDGFGLLSAVTVLSCFFVQSMGVYQKNCALVGLLNNIIESEPGAGYCNVQLIVNNGSEEYTNVFDMQCFNDKLRRPLSLVSNGVSMAEAVSFRCNIVLISFEFGQLEDYINLAQSNHRTNMDYYIVLLPSLQKWEDIPAEMETFSHVTFFTWGNGLSEGPIIVYGSGAFTSADHHGRPIAKWNTAEESFAVKQADIFPTWQDPSFNMAGKEFRMTGLENMPYLYFSGAQLKGSEIFLMGAVAKRRKFTSKFMRSPGDITGSYNSTSGHWNGVLGMLESKEVEMAIGEYGVSPDRFQVIDYAPVPLFMEAVSITFFTAPPSVYTSWYGFLGPLDWRTWITLAVTVSCFYLAARLVYWNSAIDYFDIMASIINSLSAMGYSFLNGLVPSHFVLLAFWLLPCLVINLGYTTSLMSSLTVPELSKMPDTWDQLLREHYSFSFMKYSYPTFMFQIATNETNPTYTKIFEIAMAQNPATTFIEYGDYAAIQRQVLDNKKTAAIFITNLVGGSSSVDTDSKGIVVLHKSKVADYLVYGSDPIRKNYPYYDAIFLDLLWLRDSGASAEMKMFADIEAGMFMQNKASYTSSPMRTQDAMPTPIPLSVLYGTFYLLITGLVIAALIFLLFESSNLRKRCTKCTHFK